MKIDLRKVNEPDGSFWYGIWIDDNCQVPSYGTDMVKAHAAFDKIIEVQKKPKPRYEILDMAETL